MKRLLHLSVIVILTVVFIGLFLHNSNLGDVWRLMRGTNPFWLALAFVINELALVFRTLRWRTILSADDPPPFYSAFFANGVGYMLSTVLPIRAGDVARPALLARRSTIPFAVALGTVLTERVIDLVSILTLFVWFALARWQQFSTDPRTSAAFFIIKAGAIGAIITLVLIVAFIVGLFFFRATVRRAHAVLGRVLPQRFREPWMHFFDSFVSSLDLIRAPRALAKVVGCTAGVWFCLTTQFSFTAIAMHHSLPFDASFFVTGITTLGLAIPTPGGVGGFHKACQLVLTKFYMFDIDTSVAVAILFHIVGTVPVLLTGLLLTLREGLNWKQLRHEAEDAPVDTRQL